MSVKLDLLPPAPDDADGRVLIRSGRKANDGGSLEVPGGKVETGEREQSLTANRRRNWASSSRRNARAADLRERSLPRLPPAHAASTSAGAGKGSSRRGSSRGSMGAAARLEDYPMPPADEPLFCTSRHFCDLNARSAQGRMRKLSKPRCSSDPVAIDRR